jgi:ankyrin repeat protein
MMHPDSMWVVLSGFDPTEESVSQRTAIHVAATLPSPDILKLYIDKVGERGITLKSGELQATPVHLAASDDSIACLDLLLSSSSSTDVVNTVDGEGLTPFMWALQRASWQLLFCYFFFVPELT